MSDKTTPQGGEKTENQTPQGGADKAQGASSGSTIDINQFNALQNKLNDFESDNKKYRDKFKEIEEQGKQKEKEEAEKRGEHEKLYKESEARHGERDKNDALRDKNDSDKKKAIEKRYKEALGKLTPDQKKQFEAMYSDMTNDPEILLNKLYSFNPSVNDPMSANSNPASQGNKENMKAILDKIKTDPKIRRDLNNPEDLRKLLGGVILPD